MSSPRSGQTGAEMSQEILAAHSNYRAEANTPPLQWSDTLAQSAQQWANHLASIQQMVHSGQDGVACCEITVNAMAALVGSRSQVTR